MTKNVLCPFFRKNEDYCDVGCGYISPYDVKMMVDYCTSRYTSCSRYQQLAARFPQGVEGEKFPVKSETASGDTNELGGHG